MRVDLALVAAITAAILTGLWIVALLTPRKHWPTVNEPHSNVTTTPEHTP